MSVNEKVSGIEVEGEHVVVVLRLTNRIAYGDNRWHGKVVCKADSTEEMPEFWSHTQEEATERARYIVDRLDPVAGAFMAARKQFRAEMRAFRDWMTVGGYRKGFE